MYPSLFPLRGPYEQQQKHLTVTMTTTKTTTERYRYRSGQSSSHNQHRDHSSRRRRCQQHEKQPAHPAFTVQRVHWFAFRCVCRKSSRRISGIFPESWIVWAATNVGSGESCRYGDFAASRVHLSHRYIKCIPAETSRQCKGFLDAILRTKPAPP